MLLLLLHFHDTWNAEENSTLVSARRWTYTHEQAQSMHTMKRRYSLFASLYCFCLIILLSTLACDSPRYEIRYKDDEVIDTNTGTSGLDTPSAYGPQVRDMEDMLDTPATVVARVRIHSLWDETVNRIREDLKASLSDAAYLERRDPVLTPWFTVYFSHRDAFAAAMLESSEIVDLVNHVYGFSTDPAQQAERERLRSQHTEIEAKIASIQEKVNKIP